MSDSEDSDFSDNQSEQSSEAEEVDKNEAEVSQLPNTALHCVNGQVVEQMHLCMHCPQFATVSELMLTNLDWLQIDIARFTALT